VIELMIVVGILGILASIALPLYKDYAIRAKVSEGLQLAAAAKLAVAESWNVDRKLPTNNSEAGLAAATQINGDYVSRVAVGGSGTITVTFSADEPAINGKTISLTPSPGDGAITWSCADSNIAARYLPSRCR
jgi:type IV pilus assembly protein PilA